MLSEEKFSVAHGKTTPITLFSISQTDPLKIVSMPNDIEQPEPDSVVIIIANFTDFLAENMDLEIVQSNKSRAPFTNSNYIVVGLIPNVGKDLLNNNFTPFFKVPVTPFININGNNYNYILRPKNSVTGENILPEEDFPRGFFGGYFLSASSDNRIVQGYLYGKNVWELQIGL